jgi:hypothetical protein
VIFHDHAMRTRLRLEKLSHFGGDGTHVDVPNHALHLSLLDFSHIEKVSDESVEAMDIRLNTAHVFQGLFQRLPMAQINFFVYERQKAFNSAEGGPQLMCDGRNEILFSDIQVR